VVKPSELCPATAAVITHLVGTMFEDGAVQAVNGGVEETTELLRLEWGMVFFTGSERVGKIIAGAAAKTLTPCVLELGGKSPLFITENIPEMKAMCNRIVWGKTINAGQTCVAPDYVLCHTKHLEKVLEGMKASLHSMFPHGQSPRGQQSGVGEYGLCVSPAHTQRLYDMVVEAEEAGCRVVTGGSGEIDVEGRFCPTCIIVVDPRKHRGGDGPLRCLREEIFGGILVVIEMDDDDEAIRYVRRQQGTPLAIYVFTGSSRTFEKIAECCPSGGIVRNDTLVHFATNSLPFGGLGTSGYGVAHGHHGFKTFSHQRAVLNKPCHWTVEYGGLRYAPYEKMGIIGGSGRIFAYLLRVLPTLPPVKGIARGSFLVSLGVLMAMVNDPPKYLVSTFFYFCVITGGISVMLSGKIWLSRAMVFVSGGGGGGRGGDFLG